MSDLAREFACFDPEFPQEKMQRYLESVQKTAGLEAAMQKLQQWSEATGYVRSEDLRLNRRFAWPDDEFQVEFRAQVNVLRSRYSPTPLHPEIACRLCFENIAAPGRETLRAYELTLNGKEFFLHLTPFPLFPGHFVLVQKQHLPMRMDRASVQDLVAFVERAAGYTACSNSDIEWAGASILEHHHYQVIANLSLPVMTAAAIPGLNKTLSRGRAEAAMLDFPCACIKIISADTALFARLCGGLVDGWKKQAPGKHTCNLIIRKEPSGYAGYVFLRNPHFRTAPEFLEIKSEGVGIIEMAGEGVYPLPQGPEAERLWQRIETEGLEIVKGIMRSNSPVPREDYARVFDGLMQAVS